MCSCANVEDEMHFLLICPKYNDERSLLLNYASNLNPNFNSLLEETKIDFLMNNCIRAVSKYIFKSWSLRNKTLFNT